MKESKEKKPSRKELKQRIEALEKPLIQLSDCVFSQRDNGDYYDNGNVYLQELAVKVNKVFR